MLIFALLNIWVLLGALMAWSKTGSRGVGLLLGAGVIYMAQIVAVLIGLGLVGQLQREPVLLLNFLISAVLLVWRWHSIIWVTRALYLDFRKAWGEFGKSKIALLALILILGSGLLIVKLGAVLPSTDWDGLAQHIPIAVFHLQKSDLSRIDTPYRGIHAYPSNGSLFIAWILLGTGNDVFVDLVQWPFWVLGCLAIYRLAYQTGSDRIAALLGSLVFAIAPVVLLQTRSSYVDVMLASCVLIALTITLDMDLPLPSVAFGVGCALGITLGLKYAGLLNTILLGCILLVRLVSSYRHQYIFLFRDLSIFVTVTLFLGGYWYLSNWLDLNNPFWPMAVQVMGHSVFSGVWTTDSFYQGALPEKLVDLPYLAQLWTVWLEPTALYTPDMRLGGLGPVWFAVGLPCLLLYGLQGLITKDRSRLAIFGFAFGAFALTPANWHTRYILAPVAISGVALAMMISQFQFWYRVALGGLVVSLSFYSCLLTFTRSPVTPEDFMRFQRLPIIERRSIFADRVDAIQPAMRWFDRNVSDNSIVAYSWGGVILYPFWGAWNSHQMVYVPPVSGSNWYDALKQKEVFYLIARNGSAEAQTALQDPRFDLMYKDNLYTLYALP